MDIPDLPIGAFEHIGDRKIKPQGGGGGGLGNFLAEIDPVEAFKGAANSTADEGFRQTDWMTENGWILPVAMITAGIASGALSGAALTAEGGAALGSAELVGPSLAGSQAFDAAIASGLSAAEAATVADAAAQAAISAGQGIGTATGASAGANALTTGEILGSTGFTPAPGSGASFVVDPSAVYTTASTGAPVYDFSEPLYPNQAGPTYQELGVTGVPEGGMGPTYGELGYTGLNQAEAIAAADAASAAQAASLKISPSQAIQGLKMASGLLGKQQGTPSGATAQFTGSSVPQGSVDYSGILNLLQTRSQQRNPYSLLG
jgi:hypothetical protein